MKYIDALPEFNPELLAYAAGRRALAENDPLMFAFIYLSHHVSFPGQEPTLNEFHLDFIDYAKNMIHQDFYKPKCYRDLFIAPRNSGKSSWAFTILPLWLGAFGHKKFVAAFSNKEEQAEGHLITFKAEIEQNELLRNDFPEFTRLMLTAGNKPVMNNANQIQMANGFTFMAKGVDTGVLGMKVGATRPDLLLFDDIEPGESNYSVYQANQRRVTLVDDLFMLNQFAHVLIVGTTTMQDSLIDQMRKAGEFANEYEGDLELKDACDPGYKWIFEENIKSHYWPAILTNEGGQDRSIWPELWDVEWLNRQRGIPTFEKNFMNNPTSGEAGYWSHDDIEIDEPESYRGPCVLSIDPAVTTKKGSDFTGMTVLQKGNDGIIYVRYSGKFKLPADELALKADEFIEKYGCNLIFIETNQGGDLWKQVFGKCEAKLVLTRSNAGATKTSRIAMAFDVYKQGKVKHIDHFPALVEEMTLYPNVKHDDTVDSLAQGVNVLNRKVRRVTAAQFNYLEGE